MARKETMDPPFFSRPQAVGFALLLLILLTLPVWLAKSGLSSREDAYAAVPDRNGPFVFLQQQIFQEKSEIDILFLGSSLIWAGVDTPYVQQELSKTLGRQSNVLTLGSNWRGEDLNYTILRDVLQRRKVKMLVITMPVSYQTVDAPHHQTYRWLFYGDAATKGLPLRQRLAIYGENVLGVPRQLLSLVRRNRTEVSQLPATRGALKVEQGYMGAAFTRLQLPTVSLSPDSLIYGSNSTEQFRFTDQPLSPYQMHFLDLTFDLLRAYDVPFVILHVPVWTERHSQVVGERMFWPALFKTDAPVVGVPPATLFKGMSDKEIDQLYYDEHLNVNGSEYFTRAITPALLELYAKSQHTR